MVASEKWKCYLLFDQSCLCLQAGLQEIHQRLKHFILLSGEIKKGLCPGTLFLMGLLVSCSHWRVKGMVATFPTASIWNVYLSGQGTGELVWVFPMKNANRQVLLDEMLDADLLALSQLQVWLPAASKGSSWVPCGWTWDLHSHCCHLLCRFATEALCWAHYVEPREVLQPTAHTFPFSLCSMLQKKSSYSGGLNPISWWGHPILYSPQSTWGSSIYCVEALCHEQRRTQLTVQHHTLLEVSMSGWFSYVSEKAKTQWSWRTLSGDSCCKGLPVAELWFRPPGCAFCYCPFIENGAPWTCSIGTGKQTTLFVERKAPKASLGMVRWRHTKYSQLIGSNH